MHESTNVMALLDRLDLDPRVTVASSGSWLDAGDNEGGDQ
jgi:hypothetical protein